jgi:hypothetical protein
MLKKLVMTAASAALLAGVGIGTSAPAQAQVGIEIGPGGARVYERDAYRPVIERRERRRVIVEDDDDDCRTIIRRRVNRFGEIVERRVRECD